MIIVVYPYLLMRRNSSSLIIIILRPSTVMRFSVANVVSVRMALEVVMFDKLAKSSLDKYMLRVVLLVS